MSIHVTKEGGRLLLSTIINTRYVWRVYDGYSRREASKRFREYLYRIKLGEL